ncbi:hypothetical protein [Urbifossiella limnaea]|uniref:Uncharacterized protein n=1 Tax=Urbifossiella limnaea TaxID=2528023 RepID=A0A517XLJ9_9BACT|nr:hypothetical protein [Urbifossiella limnaea]QDU18387.1 hypothetical protein ETAA1_02730 [Urbifossiella limnaea]
MTPRAAFLRALPGHGFTPPDGAVPTGDAVTQFAADVRAFTAEFWAMPPAERRTRWEALSTRATGPAAAWLAELGDGLDVTPATQPESDAAAVAAVARELVTVPPRARAARRTAWLVGCAASFPRWRAAGRAACLADPALAELDARLIAALAARHPPARVALDPWVEYQNRARARRQWADRVASVVGYAAGLLFAVSLVVFFVAVRSAPIERPAPAPALRPPPPRARVAPTNPFTAAEAEALAAYERNGWDRPVPRRYDEWVRAGRPAGVN